MRPLGYWWRGKWGQLAWVIQKYMRCCPCSLDIDEDLHITFVEDKHFRWLYYLMFHFTLFIYFSILRHHTTFIYFFSGEVDHWSRIRVLLGGGAVITIFQYHFFYFKIHIFSSFIYWRVMMVFFLTASYYANWKTILIDDCLTLFSRRTTIG